MATSYPALIITFAREEGVERLVTVGLKAGVTKFYIAIDGPKTDGQRKSQAMMHLFLNEIRKNQNVEIFVWQRTSNLGAAVGVLTAIDWFFENEEAGFIFEDDLILALEFFNFGSLALDLHRENSDIWVIAGSRMNPITKSGSASEWSHYPMIWGWATWASKWAVMSNHILEFDQPSLRGFFNARLNFWRAGANRARRGLVDAWDIPLAYAQIREKKFTVIPHVNLVTNVGFDINATNTSGVMFPLNHPIGIFDSNLILNSSISHQEAEIYDQILERQLFKIRFHHSFLRLYGPILDYFKARKGSRGPLMQRLNSVAPPKLLS